MAVIREIGFDCAHPAALARVWAAGLEGYGVRPYDEAEIARPAVRARRDTGSTGGYVVWSEPGRGP